MEQSDSFSLAACPSGPKKSEDYAWLGQHTVALRVLEDYATGVLCVDDAVTTYLCLEVRYCS